LLTAKQTNKQANSGENRTTTTAKTSGLTQRKIIESIAVTKVVKNTV